MEPAELQLLIGVASVVTFVGLFLALLFSAIAGIGFVRLLYVAEALVHGKNPPVTCSG